MADIIQIRRGTASQWTSTNPVLADGELGFETDTKKGKLGNGITAWNSLPYSFTGEFSNVADQITAATSKTTPVDADQVGITDSAAGNILKKLSWANIKATLKTYFDTLYVSVTGNGNLVQGANVTLTGTLTNRLVGTGNVTIAATATSTDIAATINAATAKTTPVDADQFGIVDSAASNVLKKLSWANIKATLLTYFNTIYEPVFSKGSLVQGTNVTLTGTLTNRLIGAGNVIIAATAESSGLALPVNRYIYSQTSFNYFSRTWNREGESIFVPFTHMIYANTDMRVDRIGFNITGTDDNTNVFIRLGIFEQNTSTGEMTRIVDAGQVGTVGAGIKEVTVNQTLTKGKMYYILFSRQGFDFVNVAVTTQDAIGNSLFYSTASAQANVNAYGTAAAGITGAFLSSYTPNPQWNFLPLILLRLQTV